MKITLLAAGKPHDKALQESITDFTNRLNKYFSAEWQIVNTKVFATVDEQKKQDSLLILNQIKKEDFVVLLDERGKMFSSPNLAKMLQQQANASAKRLVFIIGGAYGVDATIFERANVCWSLSALVFPHNIVRLVVAEQLYRACTILKNEKYHHE